MFKNIIPFALFILMCCSLSAQVPREIFLTGPLGKPTTRNHARSAMMCNEAGTIEYAAGSFVGSSNDANILESNGLDGTQPIYLCAEDAFMVNHNGDQDLSGDPNMDTEPGIGYAFYQNGPPTIDGFFLDTILSDPNISISPTNSESPFVYVDDPSGNALFQNTIQGNLTLQDFFNFGGPIQLWFAPITYDSLSTGLVAGYEGDPAGPCVDVNIEEAFSIIYLNEFELLNLDAPVANDCNGTVTSSMVIDGGLPEFDDNTTQYNITITNATDPNITGTIGDDQSRIANTPISFSVPSEGMYTVRVSDGKTCNGSFDIDMTSSGEPVPPIGLVSNGPLAGSPCMARFVLEGGLPQIDDMETYEIVSIINQDDPNLVGTITIGDNPRRSQGVTFEVPENGNYEIIIRDGSGCEFPFTQPITECLNNNDPNASSVTFIVENLTITQGEIVCTNVTVEDFTNIDGLQFSFSWDPTILEYQNIEIGDGFFLRPGDFGVSEVANGSLFGQWFDASGNSASLADGDTLFRVCFTGIEFGNTPLEIVDDPRGLEIEIIQSGEPIELISIPGSVNIPDGSFAVLINNTLDACLGESNGGIVVNIQSGIAPYTIDLTDQDGNTTSYVVNTPFRDTTLSDLPVGIYTLIIGDSGIGFDREEGIEITETSLTIDPGIVQLPGCFGDSTGILTVQVFNNDFSLTDPLPTSSLDDYTFEWSNGNTTQTATNLFVGSDPFTDRTRQFSVTVTDPNGCRAIQTQSLPQPEPIQLGDITNTRTATCPGSNDGIISLEEAGTSGGTGDIVYEWDNQQLGAVIQNLDVGTYVVTATDESGCMTIDSGAVTSPLVLTLEPMIDPITCVDADDAAIEVFRNVSGVPTGTDLRFDWTSPTGNTVNPFETRGGVGTKIEDLSPGMYNIQLSIDSTDPDLQNCSTTSEFEIVNPDSLLIQNIDIESTTNCRVPDGRAELEVIGGTGLGTYTYAWEFRGMGQANNAIATALSPDSVFIVVTDANDCIAMLDTVIGSPARPSITDFENASVNCNSDSDAFLQVNAVRGDANIIRYQWSHNSSVTTNFAAQLGPDTYLVTITDENDCTTIDSAVVTAPPAIFFSEFQVAQVPCFEEANGTIRLNAIGGAAGFSYTWTDENDVPVGEDADSLTNVLAGMYTLEAEDSNGCTQDTTVELGSKQEIVIDFDNIGGTSCFDNGLNERDGTATAMVTYADGTTGDFDFFWGNNEQTRGAAESVADSLGSGLIELLVFETVGICRATDSVEIESPPRLEFDALNSDTDNITCFGGADGAIDLAVIGGTPNNIGAPYTYEWTTGDDTEDLSGLTVGSYTVTFTDANDCIAEHTIQIMQPDSLLVAVDFDNTSDVQCAGDEDGQIALSVSGGNPGDFSYNWTNNTSSTSAIATSLAPDLYEVTVTDEEGCSGSTSYMVAQPPAIAYNVTFDPIICNDFPTTIVADPLSFSGGNGGDFTYSIDNSPSQTLDKVFQVKAGEHLLTVFDALGCAYEEVLNIPEPEAINIEFPDAENTGRTFVAEVQLGGETSLNPDIFSPLPIADINWVSDSDLDTNFICPTPLCENPIVSPLDNTTYTITVTDQNGCVAEASVLVEVDKNRNIFIPNAFAPNSRGFDLNEDFKIYSGVGVERINFARVFNRWGTMVASLEDVLPSPSGVQLWDGRLKGQRIEQGVYVYIISVTFTDQVTLLYRGDVTLLR